MDDAYKDVLALGIEEDKVVAEKFDIKFPFQANPDDANFGISFESNQSYPEYSTASDDHMFNTFLENDTVLSTRLVTGNNEN